MFRKIDLKSIFVFKRETNCCFKAICAKRSSYCKGGYYQAQHVVWLIFIGQAAHYYLTQLRRTLQGFVRYWAWYKNTTKYNDHPAFGTYFHKGLIVLYEPDRLCQIELQKVQVCDATNGNSGNNARHQKNYFK